MKNQPLVSILLPCFNAERYISEAVNSILNQSYTKLELLICDDFSTDRSFEKLGQFDDERIKLFRNSRNLGVVHTRNFLLEMVSGELIALQDADDVSDSKRIERQVDKFLKNEGLGICGTFAKVYSDNFSKYEIAEVPVHHEDIKRSLYKRVSFICPSIMVRKSVFDTIETYRQFFNRINAEDYDLAFRAVQSFESFNIPEPLYFLRMNEKSLTRRISKTDWLKLNNEKVVQKLARQRDEKGFDWLQRGEIGALNRWIGKLEKPYIKDPSLIFREAASKVFSQGLRTRAIIYCLKAVYSNPYRVLNYKYLISTVLAYLKR